MYHCELLSVASRVETFLSCKRSPAAPVMV
jgi:hypothetical protein